MIENYEAHDRLLGPLSHLMIRQARNGDKVIVKGSLTRDFRLQIFS
jgi:hypothetical protein